MKKKMKTVTIPEIEYKQLLDYKKIVEGRKIEKLSPRLVRDVRKSQKQLKEGKFVKFHSMKEVREYFDKL